MQPAQKNHPLSLTPIPPMGMQQEREDGKPLCKTQHATSARPARLSAAGRMQAQKGNLHQEDVCNAESSPVSWPPCF